MSEPKASPPPGASANEYTHEDLMAYGAQERARLACKLQEAASRARLEIDGYSPETHEGLAMLQILHALLASVEAAK